MSTATTQTNPTTSDLEAALTAVGREAAELEARLTGEGAGGAETDLSVVASGGPLLERFLDDVDEAVGQVFVAGLSFPDPELPDELASLSERAERHGLPTALAHLKRLELWVRAISGEKSTERRLELAQGAWDETQRLLAWLRLFRTELGFLIVESALSAETAGETQGAARQVPTRTVTMYPVGLELERSGMLLIAGLDIDSKMPVVLRDHLAELDPDRPLSGKVISRLFQDAVDLSVVMRGLIRLEDHPVVQRQTVMLFRPAFRATPKLLPVTEDFQPPEFPSLDPSRLRGQHMPGPFRATLSARGRQIHWTAPWPVESSEVIKLNATKLLAREAATKLELDLVARLKEDDTLRVLSATTEDDGRVFLADDPTLFRMAPEVVAASAITTRKDLGEDHELAGRWLEAAAFLFGGTDKKVVEGLREALAKLEPQGLDEHYRAALAQDLLGEVPAGDKVQAVIKDALDLALLTTSDTVPTDALSRVLGRQASSADLRYVTDELVYQALWLTFGAGLLGDLAGEVRAVVSHRFSGKLKAATPATICARALGTYLVELLDGEVDDPTKSKAVGFLEAHLADLGPARRRRRRKTTLRPELLELFQLADTRAVLNQWDRRGPIVAGLGLPALELASTCAKPLLRWRAGEAGEKAALEAGDALLIIAAAGLRPFFIL